MAGDDDRERVPAVRGADGADRARVADRPRDRRVRGRRAVRDRRERRQTRRWNSVPAARARGRTTSARRRDRPRAARATSREGARVLARTRGDRPLGVRRRRSRSTKESQRSAALTHEKQRSERRLHPREARRRSRRSSDCLLVRDHAVSSESPVHKCAAAYARHGRQRSERASHSAVEIPPSAFRRPRSPAGNASGQPRARISMYSRSPRSNPGSASSASRRERGSAVPVEQERAVRDRAGEARTVRARARVSPIERWSSSLASARRAASRPGIDRPHPLTAPSAAGRASRRGGRRS